MHMQLHSCTRTLALYLSVSVCLCGWDDRVVDRLVALNILSSAVAAELPERGRRRLLSSSSDTGL
jgi:hypothetical protein